MTINEIANFITNTNYKHLSEKNIEITKRAFIDTLAVTIAAEKKELSGILREKYKTNENVKYTLESALKNKPENLAFIIGTMSHILDYDDVNFTFLGHSSIVLIPIILALSKEHNLSGTEMIEAYIVGFEVQAKLGSVLSGKQYSRGWHTTSTLGIFGAVATACKLLKFDHNEIKYAIGMAGSFSSGIRKNFGTMTKPIHVGLTVKNALLIVNLVKAGVRSNENIFSPPLSYGLITTGENLDFSAISELGKRWELEHSGIYFKKYPCCTFTHRSIDGILALVDAYNIKEHNVEKIEVIVHPTVMDVLTYKIPKNETEAQFSLYYCLASAFIDKKVSLSSFTQKKITRKRVSELINKIEIKFDETQRKFREEQKVKVSIYTASDVYNKTVHYPSGHPKNPLTDDEFKQKFNDCTENYYALDDRKLLYEKLMQLEKQNYKDLERALLKINCQTDNDS